MTSINWMYDGEEIESEEVTIEETSKYNSEWIDKDNKHIYSDELGRERLVVDFHTLDRAMHSVVFIMERESVIRTLSITMNMIRMVSVIKCMTHGSVMNVQQITKNYMISCKEWE